MIPSYFINVSVYYIASIHFLVFVMYYTDSGAQLIAISVRQLVMVFFYESYLYMVKLTVPIILLKLALVFGVFVLNSLLAIIVIYISSMHTRMKIFNLENIKLLDGMHEGLLILSKSTSASIFCNKPA